MASVMAIESEVFGSCVGEIDDLLELKNASGWLCCARSYPRFAFTEKAA
jgi:hypothetical protein